MTPIQALDRVPILVCLALSLQPSAIAHAQGVPDREGTCVNTQIAALEHRLQSAPGGPFVDGSGSAIRYDNGGYQVSYQELPQVGRSQLGDVVTLCLIKIPRDCPAGDHRGRIYTATNVRIMESWTLADAEHACGGA